MAGLKTKYESFTSIHEKMKKQNIQIWISRLVLSMIVLLSISLSSCKDDETPQPSAKDIATEKITTKKKIFLLKKNFRLRPLRV